MEWKFNTGDRVAFKCIDSDCKGIGSIACQVVRRLTDNEADLCETGPMYEVVFDRPISIFGSGVVRALHAFEDELAPID